jgi:hypothetical protein
MGGVYPNVPNGTVQVTNHLICGISTPMNLALTESIFRHSKSLIVHAFEKLSTESRYFWQVSVTVPLSARRELDLPIDEVEYRKLFAEQRQAAQFAMRDVEDHFGLASEIPQTPGVQ